MIRIIHSVNVSGLAPAAGLDIGGSEREEKGRIQAGLHIVTRSHRGANASLPRSEDNSRDQTWPRRAAIDAALAIHREQICSRLFRWRKLPETAPHSGAPRD